MTKEEQRLLDIVIKEMGIEELPEITEVHVTWNGEKIWNMAKRLAKRMEIESLQGQQDGINEAIQIRKEVYEEASTT